MSINKDFEEGFAARSVTMSSSLVLLLDFYSQRQTLSDQFKKGHTHLALSDLGYGFPQKYMHTPSIRK
jgi:hypothetical protein